MRFHGQDLPSSAFQYSEHQTNEKLDLVTGGYDVCRRLVELTHELAVCLPCGT